MKSQDINYEQITSLDELYEYAVNQKNKVYIKADESEEYGEQSPAYIRYLRFDVANLEIKAGRIYKIV